MAGVTAKQIAQQLGISQAAVSIVLNGRPGVSDETRRLVLETADRLGYNPARITAVRERSRRLCFIFYVNQLVSIAENTTFSSFVLQGAEAAASRLGYSIFVRYFHAGEPFVEQASELVGSSDGIILLGTDITDDCRDEVARFLERFSSMPVVIIDAEDSFGVADCVINDNYGGALQAVEYLISRGCSRIGYIRSGHRISTFLKREAGLKDALRKHGLSVDTVIDTEVSFDEAYNRIDQYLSHVHDLPDAFFAENDVIAAAAIRAFNAHGIAVPDRISIIGFDDIPVCDLTAPSLSTVHSYKEQLGEAAVNILSDKFPLYADGANRTPRGCMCVSISTDLHIRASVK